MERVFDKIDIIFIVLISLYLVVLFFTIVFWLKSKFESKNIRLKVIDIIKANERHKVIKIIKPKKEKTKKKDNIKKKKPNRKKGPNRKTSKVRKN